jgi:hypothetical protein
MLVLTRELRFHETWACNRPCSVPDGAYVHTGSKNEILNASGKVVRKVMYLLVDAFVEWMGELCIVKGKGNAMPNVA